MPDDPVVYRVMFSGGELPDRADPALPAAGIVWEGSELGLWPSHHRVLVHGPNPEDATRVVRDALSSLGEFGGFDAEPVRDANGDVWHGQFYWCWEDIEWDQTPERAALSELQRAVMGALADAAEPTVHVMREVGRSGPTVEAALRELRDKGLVARHSEPFMDAERGEVLDHVDWWKLTDEAWDMLGLIKSVRYW